MRMRMWVKSVSLFHKQQAQSSTIFRGVTEVVHSEEDDDDFYDDGSDYNFFTDEVNEIQGGGGWILNDVGDTKDISSPQSSKSDNIQNGMLPENSNIQVEDEIQISRLMDPFMHTVPNMYIEEKSPCAQGILDKQTSS
ncbi:hypothetical protein Tco_0088685 [Tanacetum coccineum]